MDVNLPFMNAYGSIVDIFNKIHDAQTPNTFTQDFLATKLGFKSSSQRPFLSLLKRLGFVDNNGGVNSEYKKLRNKKERGAAIANAMKKAYSPVFEANEYASALSDSDLKSLLLQTTGLEKDSSSLKGIFGTFKALNSLADFDDSQNNSVTVVNDFEDNGNKEEKKYYSREPEKDFVEGNAKLNIAYTINLNLPETRDPEVFKAIFSNLKEYLLK